MGCVGKSFINQPAILITLVERVITLLDRINYIWGKKSSSECIHCRILFDRHQRLKNSKRKTTQLIS